MQVTGMLYGSQLLQFGGFPTAEVLGPDASEEQIKALIDRHGSVFVKPMFKGGVGKKGKAGLVGRASDLRTALKEKERLYFAEHLHGNQYSKANGVTFEGAVPAEHEVYFSITDSTRFRAPTMTLTHHGGMDIEELDPGMIAQVPFDPLTGLKAPKEIISPLVQHLPKLWELYHNFGMTTRFEARGEFNVFHDCYRALVQALYDENVTRNVFAVNVDAVIASVLLKMLWTRHREGAFGEKALETAAFTVFLYGRMIGCVAEIDDHLNRGRDMDTRTPQSNVRFVA
ncbi:succinyl-CoA synthetase subunit beta [Caballeronia ptereochthonis]|uniref:Succinyl-CoA synthetase subunit beta n=1 Tax=Caballeronia ptereochthonis TaxID=1777144 RepID=A0A158A1V9_9BURK|nr:succinyl-CoA synthetase subunit beta [Caballeronia ptereochthonis]